MTDLGLTISNEKSKKNWVLKFFRVRVSKKKFSSCTSCLTCSFSTTYCGNISNFPAKLGSVLLKTSKGHLCHQNQANFTNFRCSDILWDSTCVCIFSLEFNITHALIELGSKFLVFWKAQVIWIFCWNL